MKFRKNHNKRFKSENGAYSIVTNRENYDSQITLTDHEAKIIIDHFGNENIHRGNVKSNKEKSKKKLILHSTKQEIELNLVYPKPEKTELRLYISSRAGFKPDSGEVWFMYKKNNNLWIGSMSEKDWRAESSEIRNDDSDGIYQNSIEQENSIKIQKLKERDTFKRDREKALLAIKNSNYKCEFEPTHKLFDSRFTKRPYVEAHHLIPMGLQNDFSQSLDTTNNIFCLCPYCHRAVHYGEENLAREILNRLSEKRDTLENFSIDSTELFSFYGVEEIVK